ncbi:MAG: hypothetical protein WD768_06945 [Phycisphaeraceae bacterium]
MRTALQLACLLFLAFISPARATEQPAHLTAALELVKRVEQGDNIYIFGGNDVTFPAPATNSEPAPGACLMKADCSGFINALVVHSFKLDGRQLKAWLGLTRPNAENYFFAIEKERGFEKIDHIKDARGGDVIAMAYQRNYTGKATGHVMLVAGVAVKIEPAEPIVEGTEQWELPVIDSAVTAHGPTDTRYRKGEEGKDATGVGLGKLRVYVNEKGQCVGYTWGVHRTREKDFYPRSDRPIAVGRVKVEAVRDLSPPAKGE